MTLLDSLRERPLWGAMRALFPAALRDFKATPIFACCAGITTAALVLGGGTRGGFLSDAILELLAIPALLFALYSLAASPWRQSPTRRRTEWALLYCLALAVLPIIQLIPLPPWIWSRLPGHDSVTAVFDLLREGRPWMPISVSPNATWLSFVSLLPPLAIFISAIQLGYRERSRLILGIVGFGVISAFLGLTQVAQGPASPLRFYAFTNTSEAVGFFANRNHLAALLYSVLIYAAVFASDASFKAGSWADLARFKPATIAVLTAGFVAIVVLIAGETVARSRAGLALLIVALAGAFALVLADRRNASGMTPNKLLFGAVLVATILVVQFALYRILDRFASEAADDARIPFAHNTIHAALAFLPFGSGLGTFVPVYAMFEPPADLLPNLYANHAHNDILEFWLEAGVIGIGLMVVFVAWLGFNAVRLWWNGLPRATPLDVALARAATLVLALLIVHSFFDYPMRTEAIMAIFAVSCALLIEPLPSARAASARVEGRQREEPRHQEYERRETYIPEYSERAPSEPIPELPRGGAADLPPETAIAPAKQPAEEPSVDLSRRPPIGSLAPLRPPGGRWGEDIEWPKEWSKEGSPPEANPPPSAVGKAEKET